MSKSFSIVFLLLAGCLSGVLQAQSDGRLGDHPLIERFPDSTLEEIEVLEDSNYRLVLGTLQRNREQVVPEDSLRLRGDVTRITYQVSQEFSGADVHDFFRQQMAEKNYSELFSCSGRACGSSNYWANDIFRKRILYGPERNQYFIAMRAGEDAESAAHISLYIITRANRRIYAYLEIVEDDVSRGVVSIASPELLETLNDRGSVALPGVVFASDSSLAESTDLSAILELLRSNPGLQFYLVAHLAGDEDLQTLIDRSTNRAEFLKQQLVEAGIAPERLTARGVGPLAPACEIADCAERIELVLR